MCNWLFGITDVMAVMLILLPLYPNPVDGYIYSVNLFDYMEISSSGKVIYWAVFLAFILLGIVKIVLTQFQVYKGQKIVTGCSLGLSILTVLFLAMAREPYAVVVSFMLLIAKWGLLWKHTS